MNLLYGASLKSMAHGSWPMAHGPWPMAKNSGPTSLFKKEIVVGGVFLNWNGVVS